VPIHFDFLNIPLPGLWVVQRKPATDERGSFARVFCAEEFQEIGLTKPIVQINHSINREMGVVRGLHFQNAPFTETKIVNCIKGKVFDVAVDIRTGSKTFLRWHGEVLSRENNRSILIPDGFAHGFQTLEGNCELLYLHTEYFSQENEGALNVVDPRLSISWPLPISGMSERDRSHPFIDEGFSGVCL